VTVVIVDGGACAPRRTRRGPGRTEGHIILYYVPARRHCTRDSIPLGHCRRRCRRYYIIFII